MGGTTSNGQSMMTAPGAKSTLPGWAQGMSPAGYSSLTSAIPQLSGAAPGAPGTVWPSTPGQTPPTPAGTTSNPNSTMPSWAQGMSSSDWSSLTTAFPQLNNSTVNATPASVVSNLGFPSGAVPLAPPQAQGPGFQSYPYPDVAPALGHLAAEPTAVPDAPAAAAEAPAPAPAAPTGPAADPWVFTYLPQSWGAGETYPNNPTYNYNGFYAPSTMQGGYAAPFTDPNIAQTVSTLTAGGRYNYGGVKPGDVLTDESAAGFPRMRKSLYDFNMGAYGNPYGPTVQAADRSLQARLFDEMFMRESTGGFGIGQTFGGGA